MRRLLLLAILVCVIPADGALGLGGPWARSRQPGGAAVQDLAAILEPIRARFELPALGGAIVTPDGLVAIGVTGTRRAGAEEPVTTMDDWHLGSCTKAMTATLIARLVERGALSWSTTLAAAFPEFKNRMDPAWHSVTIQQLLANRGGSPRDLNRDGLWRRLWTHEGTPTQARRLLLESVTAHPPEYPPGSRYIYSNANFAIAGHMAETIIGEPWEDLMRREVFAPLGMSSAGFGAPGISARDGPADQPRGHRSDNRPVEPGPGADNPAAIGPAGTVHASLTDWAVFVAAHLRGARGEPAPAADGTLYLVPGSWSKLHTPPEGEYALGWVTAIRPWAKGEAPGDIGRVLTHNGSNTMWFCVTWLAPEQGFAVLITTNTGADGARATDAAAAAVIRHWLDARPGG